ncbi:MAG TPA: enoyl-CoA hydratase-related protein [Nitrospira sp.]|nr:enoyl-CoA hydratase-related protein [Nitrospira sp.]
MNHQLLTISHQIARITLHNPPANTITGSVLGELEHVLSEVEQDTYVRAVIVTGSGRFFCAGADIHDLTRLNTSHAGTEFALQGQALFNHIERYEKPVLAAINGICVGGGLELALACHMRIAASGATLGLPEITLGLIPGFGGTQRLPRVVGMSKAAEMMLTGASITADEALRIGLVSGVAPGGELMTQAESLAGAIATHGEAAVQAVLHAIRGGFDIPLSEGLVREAELFGHLCATSEKRKALQSFIDKRQARMAETEVSGHHR